MHRSTIFTIALFGIAGPSALRSEETIAAPPVVGAPYAGTAACNFNRVMVGPDGTGVVTWLNDRSYLLGPDRLPTIFIVTGRIHEPALADQDRFLGFQAGGQRLLPIRWTPEGRLLVRVHERQQRAVSVDPLASSVSDLGPLDPAWARVHLVARSHGNMQILRDPGLVAKARMVDGKGFIRGTATLGRTADLLAVRYPSLQLARFTSRGARDIGLNAGQTRMLVALPHGEGDAAYLGSPIALQHKYRPYQQALFDLATGTLAGSFAADAVGVSRPLPLAHQVERLNEQLARSGSVILDASLSGDVLVALTLSSNGDRRIIRVSGAGINERSLCTPLPGDMVRGGAKPPYPLAAPVAAGPSPLLRIFGVAPNGSEMHRAGRPIVIKYGLNKTAARDLVLYFHGGPGASFADGYFPLPVEKLLTPGRDVVGVEYAGSIGGGIELTRRLARQGMKALELDVDSIFRWARKQRYQRIFILGSSFGGIPSLLAVKRHREVVAASFLVAPALRLQDPSAWASHGSGLAPVGTNTQLAYEEAYLGRRGGRERFARAMAELVRSAPLGLNDHFYFAELDPMSRPEHLPASLSPRIILPRTVHAASLARDEVWNDILPHLN